MADLVGKISDLVGAAEKTSGTRKVNTELGKDAFLQLLVAQLKNQDPMKPMEDTAFIGEMAQFSSLEQMQNLNQLMAKQQTFGALSQATGMIGKYVTLQNPGEGSPTISGKVDEIRSKGGEIKVVIAGEEYDSTTILNVADKAPTTTSSGK
jgi:flagellar basal-body rod modification protein FlgD